MSTSDQSFDWMAIDVVIAEQAAIAVYESPAGAVVIRDCPADATMIGVPARALQK